MMFSDFAQVEVVRVIDGDTFVAKFSTGLPNIYREMSVRLKGIDSPERSGKRKCEKKDAERAKQELAHFIGDQKVDLYFCEADKFFRLLCVAMVNGQEAGEHMLSNNWAVPYAGSRKLTWKCK